MKLLCGNVGPPSRWLTTCRRGQRGWVQRFLGGRRRQGQWRSDPRLQKLDLGASNVTFLMGTETEMVHEVEKFRLDLVGLNLIHGKGSGISCLERVWTLFHSGVSNSERCPTGVAIFVLPGLMTVLSEFTPVSKRVASLRLRTDPDYGPNTSSADPPFLESLEPVSQKVLLLGTPSFSWVTSMLTLAATVKTGGAWLEIMAPLIWTRAVFSCWTSVLVMDCP